jgi:hypothetical protein
MPEGFYKVTETQKGAIAEDHIATQLILQSNGRLSPFKPIADDVGIDMLVYDKETGFAVPLQIKSRTTAIKGTKTVHFEVRRATFRDHQGAFLLAVLVDTQQSEVRVTRPWLIPMRELQQVANKRGEKLVIRPSHDMHSRDKYSEYRYAGLAQVVYRLTEHCEQSKTRRDG